MYQYKYLIWFQNCDNIVLQYIFRNLLVNLELKLNSIYDSQDPQKISFTLATFVYIKCHISSQSKVDLSFLL